VNSTPIVGTQSAVSGLQVVNDLRAAFGTDKNRNRQIHEAGAVTYRNGPVDTGVFFTFTKFNNIHVTANAAGPGGRDDFNAAGAATLTGLGLNGLPMYGDPNTVTFVNYFKYSNGRFFFNAEYDFQYGDVRRNGGRPLSVWADAWMLELGSLCGPAKFALGAFYSSGSDRRGGLLNLTNNIGTIGATLVYDRNTLYAPAGGRQEAIKPYVWLMGIYGGGNNAFDTRGYPTYTDWFSYVSRLDYAVAANLNVWGSYVYAMRASNTGTRIAQFAGVVTAVPGRGASSAAVAVANVPDNYLGWEADLGVDWKLLEGLTFKGQFAYWQPGDWFKWAYVDYSNLATTFIAGQGGGAFPVNPNRGIDPLIGFQGSLLVEF